MESTETQEKAPKGKKKKSTDLDVDFENFSVPKERAEGIRSDVEWIKSSEMLQDFLSLIKEYGEEEISDLDNHMAQLIKEEKPRFFRLSGMAQATKKESPEAETPTEPREVEFEAEVERDTENTSDRFDQMLLWKSSSELKVFDAKNIIMEIQFLPKQKDFILFYLDTESKEKLKDFHEFLGIKIDEAKKAKAARAREWQKRFKKTKA